MGLENLEAHPNSRFRDLRSLLSPDRSHDNLGSATRASGSHLRIPKLANAPFVRFMAHAAESNDKDEGDIYRDKVEGAAVVWLCWQAAVERLLDLRLKGHFECSLPLPLKLLAIDQYPSFPKVMNLVFTHERWDNHRSTLRYAKHLLYMFNSNMFKARGRAGYVWADHEGNARGLAVAARGCWQLDLVDVVAAGWMATPTWHACQLLQCRHVCRRCWCPCWRFRWCRSLWGSMRRCSRWVQRRVGLNKLLEQDAGGKCAAASLPLPLTPFASACALLARAALSAAWGVMFSERLVQQQQDLAACAQAPLPQPSRRLAHCPMTGPTSRWRWARLSTLQPLRFRYFSCSAPTAGKRCRCCLPEDRGMSRVEAATAAAAAQILWQECHSTWQ